MFKLSFAVVTAILILSVSVHSEDGDVTDLLEKLKTTVDQSIQEATLSLNQIVSDVKDASASTTNKTETSLNSIQEGFKSGLELLKNKSEEAGINIDECLEGSDEKLADISDQLFKDFANKDSELSGQGILYAVVALDKVQTLSSNELTEIDQNLHGCVSSWSPKDCLDEVSAKIQEDIIELPEAIADGVEDAKEFSQNIISSIENVGSSTVNEFNIEGSKLVAAIIECATSKTIQV